MKRVRRVLPEMRRDLREAASWYDKQHRGLGARLIAASRQSLAEISQWPDAAPRFPGWRPPPLFG